MHLNMHTRVQHIFFPCTSIVAHAHTHVDTGHLSMPLLAYHRKVHAEAKRYSTLSTATEEFTEVIALA